MIGPTSSPSLVTTAAAAPPSSSFAYKRSPSPTPEGSGEKFLKIEPTVEKEDEQQQQEQQQITHATIINNFTMTLSNLPASPFKPLFLHQFMETTKEQETLSLWSKYQFTLKIHHQSMAISISASKDASPISEEELKQTLGHSFLSKFPPNSIFFCSDESLFLKASELKDAFVQGTLKDEDISCLSARIQPLLLMFIDGASIIDGEDLKWQVKALYKDSSLVGYATCYPFLFYPEGVRLRISQFFILPPFQRQGLGSKLYSEIINAATADETISQITVEDPSIVFSDFRLLNDLSLPRTEKLTPLQRLQCSIIHEGKQFILRNDNENDKEDKEEEAFVNWRKSVKKMLLKRDAECIPPPEKREARLQRLDELFNEEFKRYKRILKAPPTP